MFTRVHAAKVLWFKNSAGELSRLQTVKTEESQWSIGLAKYSVDLARTNMIISLLSNTVSQTRRNEYHTQHGSSIIR